MEGWEGRLTWRGITHFGVFVYSVMWGGDVRANRGRQRTGTTVKPWYGRKPRRVDVCGFSPAAKIGEKTRKIRGGGCADIFWTRILMKKNISSTQPRKHLLSFNRFH